MDVSALVLTANANRQPLVELKSRLAAFISCRDARYCRNDVGNYDSEASG
jgi:hypothetical protein